MKAAAPTGRQIAIEGVVVVAKKSPRPAIAALRHVVGIPLTTRLAMRAMAGFMRRCGRSVN